MRDTYFERGPNGLCSVNLMGPVGPQTNWWIVTSVETTPAERRGGRAGRVMRQVTAAADTEGAVMLLSLEPQEEHDVGGALGRDALAAWYGRLGFVEGEDWWRRDPVGCAIP